MDNGSTFDVSVFNNKYGEIRMTQDSHDPAGMISAVKTVCEKTCGSKRCKAAIKSTEMDHHEKNRKCPGVGGHCVAKSEATPNDKIIANEFLSTGNGNTVWLNSHGKRAAKSHLGRPSSMMALA
jgi:hypothetical protein